MNKKGKSAGKEIFIGVAVIIIAALIIGGGSISGIFSSPKIILVVQDSFRNEVCPNSVNFNNDGSGTFLIKERNSGSEGSLYTELSTTSNITFNPNKIDAPFNNSTLIAWNVPSQSYQDFNFKLNRTSLDLGNFSIKVTYWHEGIFSDKNFFCCNYKKDYENSYSFINQICP